MTNVFVPRWAQGPIVMIGFALFALAVTPAVSQSIKIVEYTLPPVANASGDTIFPAPAGITVGPDGALWFAEDIGGNNVRSNFDIGRITTSGVVTYYAIPFANGGPEEVTAGPAGDGGVWFTTQSQTAAGFVPLPGFVGRLSTAGTFSQYPLSPPGNPWQIMVGPDGALWFTDTGTNSIGRITTAGAIVEYPVPTPNSQVDGITTGPDGALWFGRITTGGMITEYPVPSSSLDESKIVVGPDGALWFTEGRFAGGSSIGRITTSGVVTEYAIPKPVSAPVGITDSAPVGITVGPDGALWFGDPGTNSIGRITTTGAITEYPVPTPSAYPGNITLGPDGALWFTEFFANKIGRLQITSPVGPSVNDLGIVNNASFAAGSSPLAPGSIVAIFGNSLTDGTACLQPTCFPTLNNGKLNTTLNGAQVTVNGMLAPILYASPSQLGIQMPIELTGDSTSVQVTVGGQTSAPHVISLAQVAPGIFFTSSVPNNLGGINHVDGSAVTFQNPAKAGELVLLYATGLGQVTTAVPTGELPPPGGDSTVLPVTVSFDGVPVTPDFAGLSGCCVGENQVNVRIPSTTRSGDDIPVLLTVGGQQSNTVITSVRPN
jgi:virginiamycin B lyase